MKNTIWYRYSGLAFLTFIINFSFTFQLSNLTVLLKFAGSSDSLVPLIWLVPPLTGMFIQPIIGFLSDNSSTRFGKRKPYIIGWGICAALSFFLLPINPSLMSIVLFTFIIDCSLNGSAECLRALTADIFTKDEERTRAFSFFAFFSGLGGIFGALLPNFVQKFLVNHHLFSQAHVFPSNLIASYFITGCLIALSLLHFFFYKEKYKNAVLLDRSVFFILLKKLKNKLLRFKEQDSQSNPLFMKILTTHALSWGGIFIFWLYFSFCIGQNIYGLPLLATVANTAGYRDIMHQVSLDVSYYFSVYQYVALIFTLSVPYLAKYIKVELLHGITLLLGGSGIALIGLLSSSYGVFIACLLIGILWGSLLVLPYAIVLKRLPQDQVGTYLGVFNISITLPQILGGLFAPIMYSFILKSHASYMLLFAGFLIILSGMRWIKLLYLQSSQKNIPQVTLSNS